MIITVDLPDDTAERLRREAAALGVAEPDLLRSLVVEHYEAPVVAAPPRYVPPAEAPAWLADILPRNPATDGTNGMHRVFGALADYDIGMNDEELEQALQRLDKEDSGRD